jgi:hypothetical protein
MALIKRKPEATFEVPPASPATSEAAQTPWVEPTPAPAPAPAAAPAPAPAAALVPVKPAGGLALASTGMASMIAQAHAAFDSLKDALRVNWDTLTSLKAAQGRLATRDGKVVFGEWIEFELLSYQDNWLISPGGDTDEAKELARYSDDGKTVKDTGEDVSVYIERLKSLGYKDARMSQRLVLVASLTDCDKTVTIDDGMLFQIDLPPTSRAAFERYKNQAAFDAAKGKAGLDGALVVRATATVQQQRGNAKNEYTVLNFARAKSA